MMIELGDPLTEEEVEEFFSAVDVNNDGSMSYQEFVGAPGPPHPPTPARTLGPDVHPAHVSSQVVLHLCVYCLRRSRERGGVSLPEAYDACAEAEGWERAPRASGGGGGGGGGGGADFLRKDMQDAANAGLTWREAPPEGFEMSAEDLARPPPPRAPPPRAPR